MQRIRHGIISLVAIIAVAGVCSSALAHDGYHGSQAASETVARITEEDIEYAPEDLVVHAGQAIRLENKDPFEHKSRVTLQKKGGGLGYIALKDHVDKPGASYTFKLNSPGVYEIRCLLHDGMTAAIHVVR